jgi:acyl-coenzyme A thioesterase PaaI-like protein
MAYPPEHHFLRDLRPVSERDAQGTRSYLEVVPEACGSNGALRTGVLATLVDMTGGEAAVRAAHPSWVATSDLVLHVIRPVSQGVVCSRAGVLRKTRSTIVLEVEISQGEDLVGLATMTFAVLEARSEVQRMGAGVDEPRTDFGRPGTRLRAGVDEVLGLRLLDASGGVVEQDLTPYVENSLGALQGGVVAVVLEVAAEALGRSLFGTGTTALDLSINYLSLVKTGPARTRARVLRRRENEALVRVELRDAGGADRLCTVATAVVVR